MDRHLAEAGEARRGTALSLLVTALFGRHSRPSAHRTFFLAPVDDRHALHQLHRSLPKVYRPFGALWRNVVDLVIDAHRPLTEVDYWYRSNAPSLREPSTQTILIHLQVWCELIAFPPRSW